MTMYRRGMCLPVVVLLLLVLVLAPASGFAAEKAKPQKADESMNQSDELPVPELTLGARAGDGIVEGYGDILAPIFATKSGIVFVNPRMSATDHSAEEYNLGFGYRHLLREKGMILGANIYYDHRETELENRFNQVGFGVEYLSDWIDARANYYLPDDDVESSETEVVTETQSTSSWTSWGDPYAVGNTIYQNGTWYKAVTTTTTKQRFIQYEEALEGWDMEMGVRLPIPVVMDYSDVKLFGGFYHYNRSFEQDDLNGVKGRLEIKAMPSLYLDAELFENKELTGHDYYLGARMSVPFDVAAISKGRNPFAGAVDGMRIQKQKTTIASRLTEMVMRDLHVQTEFSEIVEEVEKRQQTSTTQIVDQKPVGDTLGTDIIFVNQDTGNDANPGTIDAPVQQIPTGISMGNNVFVMASINPYLVNLEIAKSVNLMGQGYPIGHGGKYLNGDSRYAVLQGGQAQPPGPGLLGPAGGPTVFVNGPAGADSVQIRGFEIRNEMITMTGAGLLAADPFGSIDVAVDSVPEFELAYNKLDNALIGLGAIYEDMPGFSANVHDNVFDTLGVGAGVITFNTSGDLAFRNNTIQNTLVGMVGVALADDPLSPAVLNTEITGNIVGGGGLNILSAAMGSLSSIDLLDLFPDKMTPMSLPGISLSPAPLINNLPSLSALNVAAIQLSDSAVATVNATISGNLIEDNLLGIGALGVGSNASLNVNISNNELIGGGSQAIIDLFAVVPEPVDMSLIGIWLAGVDEASINNAVISHNTITDHVLGMAVVGVDEAKMNNGTIAYNKLEGGLAGIGVVGVGEPQMDGWWMVGNEITGSGVPAILRDVLSFVSMPPQISNAVAQVNLPDMGLAGILVLGIDDAIMNNYVISGNAISQDVLGIGVLGINDAVMNNYQITYNSIEGTALGIAVAGIDGAEMKGGTIANNSIPGGLAGVAVVGANGADMDNWWIVNNEITGSGIPAIISDVLPFISMPDDISNALAQVTLPDAGLAGILVLGINGAEMNNYFIGGNTINQELLGIGVLGAMGAAMNDYQISYNLINRTLVGVAEGGLYGASMTNHVVAYNTINEAMVGVLAGVMYGASLDGMVISHNTIIGGGVDDLLAALHPLANTNIIDDEDILAALNLPVPDTGAIGILALNDDGEFNDVSIENNAISKNLVGIAAFGMAEADLNNLLIGNNTIDNSVMGVGLFLMHDAYANGTKINNNVINDPAIGVLALAMDTAQMNNMEIAGNQINRSLIGILAASEHSAQMTNTAIGLNTISGAFNPTQVGLLTAFLVLTDFDDNMGWLIHRDWNPLLFPPTGLVGIDVRVNQANQSDVRIEGNQFSNFAQAGLVTIEDVTNLPIAYINNTSSDGQFYVAATNATFILTQSGNIPSPVVIIP